VAEIPDDEGPAGKATWLAEQRAAVQHYLARERVPGVTVAPEPSWLLPPYVAIWPVLGTRSGERSYWAISGDLPTDFLSADTVPDARRALAAFAERWRALAAYMERGERHPTIWVESRASGRELGAMLASRARLLAAWVAADEFW
jgi:hypothetical protein